MKHNPGNRYLALAATQTTPVPPPGREWTTEQLREIRIEQARDNERAWATQREALLERRPNVDPFMLARTTPQLRALDEALAAVREWIVDQGGD